MRTLASANGEERLWASYDYAADAVLEAVGSWLHDNGYRHFEGVLKSGQDA